MSKYRGKRILVVGFGASGVEAAKFLSKQGAKVVVTETKQKSELLDSVNKVADLKLEFELGRQNTKAFQNADMVVLSPGVPYNHKALDEIREKNIPITGEVELAAQQIKEPIIAITGTNGKTTTATLIKEMFAADGKSAFLGGPDSQPLLQYVNEGAKADVVLAELSAFQLDLIEEIFPAVGIFTNLDPDHLDRYPDYTLYVATKKKLLGKCGKNSFVILNYDDTVLRSWEPEVQGRLMWITKQNPMSIGGEFAEKFSGAYFDVANKRVVAKLNGKDEIYDLSQYRLMGEQNKENAMSAICAARSQGISQKAIQSALTNAKPVSHRLEFIRKKDGVYFFNDSKATNPASVRRGLMAFKQSPVILLAGGKDRNAEFGALTDLVRTRCKILILLGEAKEKMNRAIGDFAETYLVGTFEEGVLLAFQKSRAGDIILLSPGCDSQDMFRSYEERGDYFKKLVSQL